MALQEAAEAAVTTWTEPDTGRDLVALSDLLALAEDMGVDVGKLPLALGQLPTRAPGPRCWSATSMAARPWWCECLRTGGHKGPSVSECHISAECQRVPN